MWFFCLGGGSFSMFKLVVNSPNTAWLKNHYMKTSAEVFHGQSSMSDGEVIFFTMHKQYWRSKAGPWLLKWNNYIEHRLWGRGGETSNWRWGWCLDSFIWDRKMCVYQNEKDLKETASEAWVVLTRYKKEREKKHKPAEMLRSWSFTMAVKCPVFITLTMKQTSVGFGNWILLYSHCKWWQQNWKAAWTVLPKTCTEMYHENRRAESFLWATNDLDGSWAKRT